MNVYPFIIAAYAAGILVPAVLAVAAWARLRRAERRLAAVDPRSRQGRRAAR
jgi:cytochrome c biogenesis protein CcdA